MIIAATSWIFYKAKQYSTQLPSPSHQTLDAMPLNSPLNANVFYPMVSSSDKKSTLGGFGIQQVFRPTAINHPRVSGAGVFAELNPKAGTCPPENIVAFLFGDSNTIGTEDFVYAIRLSNVSSSNVNVDTLLVDTCIESVITSAGACRLVSMKETPQFAQLASGLDFFFIKEQSIPPGGSSVIVFFTSPNDPVAQKTSMGIRSFLSSAGHRPDDPTNLKPIYAPCSAAK